MRKTHKPNLPHKPRLRGSALFKRTEATRLLKATTDAGLLVRGVEVDPDGALRVLVDSGKGKPDESGGSSNSWDEVLDAKDKKRTA